MKDENEILFEQYKLYVEMADRVSQRRITSNQFYSTALSGMFAALSLSASQNLCSQDRLAILTLAALLGLIVCAIWWFNIFSAKQLNSAKWKVVHELEKKLPVSPWDIEWDKLERGNNWKVYVKHTTVERFIPAAVSVPYVLLLIYCIRHLNLREFLGL
ncbi:MAG: hypothetical protein KKA55_01935 [Proteobacteria bacterium]|nr:hypothetical protein [Pseudomonadota bacterium]MBU1594279.1 hypothetical protein [Pseudomonadota bacterium]